LNGIITRKFTMKEKTIRALFSRDHATVHPNLGVFLGGISPPDGDMKTGWRRKIISVLQNDKRLDPSMIIVSPEPKSGYWEDIDGFDDSASEKSLEISRKKQMHWELQYLKLCNITTFWLPAYWTKEKSGVFAPNIGPSSRWEFGYFFQEYLKDKQNRNFIVGSPEDAQGVEWAREITRVHGIKWHTLRKQDKSKLVAESFIEEIADTLIKNKPE